MTLTYLKVFLVWGMVLLVYLVGQAFAQTVARNFDVEKIMLWDKIYSVVTMVTSLLLFATGVAMLYLEFNNWMTLTSLLIGSMIFFASIATFKFDFSWFLYFNAKYESVENGYCEDENDEKTS